MHPIEGDNRNKNLSDAAVTISGALGIGILEMIVEKKTDIIIGHTVQSLGPHARALDMLNVILHLIHRRKA